MTERRGGSDVGAATETVAIQEQGDMFRCEEDIHGVFPSPYLFCLDFMATSGLAPPPTAT